MPTKYVTVNGTPVHYYHTGRSTLPGAVPELNRGELLLFIHGDGSNGHTWYRQLDAFAPAHSPLAFDFPGHGRSGGIESLLSIEAYRDCLGAFVQALALRPAVLVGWSMGGAVAVAYALAHPQRVRGVVLVATAARFALPEATLATWKDVMRGRLQQPFTTEAFSPKTDFTIAREAWMEQVKTDPRVRYYDMLACNRCDLSSRLADLRTPTLIVAGRDDTVTPVASAEALHRGIRGAQLVIVDDAGHHLPTEKALEFHAAVSAFLTEL